VIGHIGVYKRYLGDIFHGDGKIQAFVEEAEYEMARLCAQSDMILEVNTSGLFAPLAQTLPDGAFLKQYYNFGGRTVCIGSDAHTSADAGRGIDKAYDLIQQTGFKYITLPWDRENPIGLKE
jgi:histidinol-phosphatase (PHP family)